MEVIGTVLIVLLLARVFGELAVRLGVPSSVGEMLAGIAFVLSAFVAGPHQHFVGDLPGNEVLRQVSNLGIFFLLLMTGVEMQISDMVHDARKSSVVALGGMILPMAVGVALGFAFLSDSPLRPAQSILIGVAISITAIAASAKILQEFDMLKSETGRVLIGAALFDDILGLFLLALLSSMIETGTLPGAYAFAVLLAKVLVFFVVTGLLGVHVYPHISKRIQEMQAVAIDFSALIVVALAYGLLAELLGMHWAVGAFMAGLFFEGSRVGSIPYEDMRLILNALTAGVLGPLFFAWIGLQADLTALVEIPAFVVILALAGFVAKAVGGNVGARSIGYPANQAAIIGVGLAPRGEIMIVVVTIALEAGLIGDGSSDPIARNLFSALILMALVNTALAPLVLRYLLNRPDTGGR